MSTRPDLLRRLRRSATDGGFSLIEIIVALSIFSIIAIAALPLLLTSLKVTVKVKLETEAKNLSQLQVERMRGLAFHVDRQNGPFIDLLDLYYTNTGTAVQTRADGTTGQWLADAAGVDGAPVGPAYLVTKPSVDGVPGFRQRVYTQFLRTTATRAVVPATYDSQVVGRDNPPAQLVSVTVLTNFTRSGRSGLLRTYTEVADESSSVAFISSQAQSQALRVTSTSADQLETLIGQAGQAKADGSLTTGSVAGVQGEAASAEVLGGARVLGAIADASAPANPAGTAGVSATGNALQLGTSSCGWVSFGKSRVVDATATTAAGYPVVPANAPADVTSPGATVTRSGLVSAGSGCGSKSFAWRNVVDAPAYPVAYGVRNSDPLVSVEDVPGGEDLTATSPAVGTVSVAATGLLDVPRSVTARATATTGVVRVLPTGSFSAGLVTAQLESSQITCRSGAVASASYKLRLRWPGQSSDRVFELSTAAVNLLPPPSTILFTEGGVPRNLGEYLDWKVATGVTEGANGIRSLGPVFTLSGKAAAVGRDFTLTLGTLSCVADDNR